VKSKNILFFALVAATLFSLSFAVNSITPFRGFVIQLPQEVDVQPGQNVVVNGGVLNIGFYWEHNFTLTYSGLPSDFNVTITPNYWENLMTIRAWDNVNGTYRVPVPFNVSVTAPDSATGVYAVNITGQEHSSYKQTSNSTVFILRVGNATGNVTTAVSGTISISDILVPETVNEFVPFNVSFNVVNNGDENQSVNVSLNGPSDWTVTAPQNFTVPVNGSVPIVFSVIPTSTAGNLAVMLQYPYQQTILNITKAGPYLVPTTPQAPSAPQFSLTGLTAFVQQNTVLSIIIVLVVAILIWYFVSTYSFYSKRKKPEEMKKQIDVMPKTIETTSEDDVIETSSQDTTIETQ